MAWKTDRRVLVVCAGEEEIVSEVLWAPVLVVVSHKNVMLIGSISASIVLVLSCYEF